MRHDLAADLRSRLAEFAQADVLVAFDFDGTLAPIVHHPSDAFLREETRALLQQVCVLYPCVVISGRAREDAEARLHGIELRKIVGNHGADASHKPGLAAAVRTWREELTPALADLQGVWVEDKGLSLAVHYRGTQHGDAVLRRIGELPLPGARVTNAKKAVNIVSRAALDKGEALEQVRRQFGCGRVIFVGDDDTDEDVFAKSWSGALLGIRVGNVETAAAFRLRDQLDVDRVLEALIEERAANPSVRKSTAAGRPGSSPGGDPDPRSNSSTPR